MLMVFMCFFFQIDVDLGVSIQFLVRLQDGNSNWLASGCKYPFWKVRWRFFLPF